MTSTDSIILFHASGIRLAASGQGRRCLVEVSLERAAFPEARQVKLEVLYQSRGRRGLPVGTPTVLYRAVLPLRPSPARPVFAARCWLPRGITPELAGNCHFRVGRDKMQSSSGKQGSSDA